MGDFNEITCPNEKLGGTIPNVNRFQSLNDFLTNINAEALQVSGNLFTWKKTLQVSGNLFTWKKTGTYPSYL